MNLKEEICSYSKNSAALHRDLRDPNNDLLKRINNFITDDISLKEKLILIRNGHDCLPKCVICNTENVVIGNSGCRFLQTCSSVECKSAFKKITGKRVSLNVDWNKRNEKSKQTCLKNLGCEWPSQNKEVREKIKEVCISKYGVENVYQSEEIKNKIKQEFLNKYGVDNYAKTDECKNKIKETSLKKYGVDHYSKTDECKNKIKETSLKRYGVENVYQSDDVMNKIKETSLKKYGVDHYSKTDECKNKIKETSLKRYSKESYNKTDEFKLKMRNKTILNLTKLLSVYDNILIDDNNYNKSISTSSIHTKCLNCQTETVTSNLNTLYKILEQNISPCKTCFPVGKFDKPSNPQNVIIEFIKQYYTGTILKNYGKGSAITNGYELDIFLPDINFAIEFNGNYWHSEKHKPNDYHINKKINFDNIGIDLLQIWSDDWFDYTKKEILKSFIIDAIGKNLEYSKNCLKIKKELTSNKLTKFLLNNNLYDIVDSDFYYTIRNKNEIVFAMGVKEYKNGIMLNNISYKSNTLIKTNLNDILKLIKKEFCGKSIYLKANLDIIKIKDNIFEDIGFTSIRIIKPTLFYLIKGKRVSEKFINKYDIDATTLTKLYDSGSLLLKY